MHFIIKNKTFLFHIHIIIFKFKNTFNYIILPFKETNISISTDYRTFKNNPMQNIFSQLNRNNIFT